MDQPAEPFDRKRVGDYVRDLLNQRGVRAQANLARYLGISQPSVNRWAKNNGNPDTIHWAAIETFFELDSGTLVGIALAVVERPSLLAGLLEQVLRHDDDGLSEDGRSIIAAAVEELQRCSDTGTD